MLLQPERTLRALCPLLGRTVRRPLATHETFVNPSQNHSEDFTDHHNLSAVCDVHAAAEADTASDLRVTAGATARIARLYGYKVPRDLRQGE